MSNFANKATISYICPSCGHPVMSIAGMLDLAGDMFVIKCSNCNSSKMTITKTNDNKLRFMTPCFWCKKEHSNIISLAAIMSRSLITIPCGLSNFDVLFIGKQDEVRGALENTILNFNKYIDKMEPDTSNKQINVDSELLSQVLYTLKEMAHDGNIRCSCSSGKFVTNINDGVVTIRCKVCHKCANIDVSEGSMGAHNLLDAESLYLIDDYFESNEEDD